MFQREVAILLDSWAKGARIAWASTVRFDLAPVAERCRQYIWRNWDHGGIVANVKMSRNRR